MAFDVRRTGYYTVTVEGHSGQASKLLSVFAGVGVSLLAFEAVSLAPMRTRFALFPDDGSKMREGARKAGLDLDGPHDAVLIQGDDESGALAGIHDRLARAEQEDCDKAIAALKG